MKVRELMEELAKHDSEAEVIDVAYMTVIALMNEIERREWSDNVNNGLDPTSIHYHIDR